MNYYHCCCCVCLPLPNPQAASWSSETRATTPKGSSRFMDKAQEDQFRLRGFDTMCLIPGYGAITPLIPGTGNVLVGSHLYFCLYRSWVSLITGVPFIRDVAFGSDD